MSIRNFDCITVAGVDASLEDAVVLSLFEAQEGPGATVYYPLDNTYDEVLLSDCTVTVSSVEPMPWEESLYVAAELIAGLFAGNNIEAMIETLGKTPVEVLSIAREFYNRAILIARADAEATTRVIS